MNEKEAKEIYSQGPRFDVGVDAQYYIAKGYIEAIEKSKFLEKSLANICDTPKDGISHAIYEGNKALVQWNKEK